MAHKLLHGDEQRVWADAGYGGAEKRKELKKRNLEWFIGMRPGSRKKLGCSHIKKAERIKVSVRAKVEYAFFYIKRMFGYSKIRYRGLAKNNNRLYVLSGLVNLLRCQKYLLA